MVQYYEFDGECKDQTGLNEGWYNTPPFLDEAVCVTLWSNDFVKGINIFVLSPVMGKIVALNGNRFRGK